MKVCKFLIFFSFRLTLIYLPNLNVINLIRFKDIYLRCLLGLLFYYVLLELNESTAFNNFGYHTIFQVCPFKVFILSHTNTKSSLLLWYDYSWMTQMSFNMPAIDIINKILKILSFKIFMHMMVHRTHSISVGIDIFKYTMHLLFLSQLILRMILGDWWWWWWSKHIAYFFVNIIIKVICTKNYMA